MQVVRAGCPHLLTGNLRRIVPSTAGLWLEAGAAAGLAGLGWLGVLGMGSVWGLGWPTESEARASAREWVPIPPFVDRIARA